MNIPEGLPELSALFEKLGAPNPEAWASSQIHERIPQLHRFLFLRQAWSQVLPEDALSWIDLRIQDAEKNPAAPFAGTGLALKRAMSAGVSREDLSLVARGMQAELLLQLCYMLEDSGLVEPELDGIGWGLFQTDEAGNAIAPIGSLHESVLELDPTGREMRPKEHASDGVRDISFKAR